MQSTAADACGMCGGALGKFRVVISGKPFHATCSHDARDHRIADLEAALRACASRAGHHDPAAGCRMVLATVRAALKDTSVGDLAVVNRAADETIQRALTAARYLRDEADFNRSWVDGRRPRSGNTSYDLRRKELADERDAWATAIETLVRESQPMKSITVRSETRDGSTFIVAEGPSPDDIAKAIHERLVAGINGKIDMEFARQLVALGWTPPPGHPILSEPAKE